MGGLDATFGSLGVENRPSCTVFDVFFVAGPVFVVVAVFDIDVLPSPSSSLSVFRERLFLPRSSLSFLLIAFIVVAVVSVAIAIVAFFVVRWW